MSEDDGYSSLFFFADFEGVCFLVIIKHSRVTVDGAAGGSSRRFLLICTAVHQRNHAASLLLGVRGLFLLLAD